MSETEYWCELCGYKFDIRTVDRSKIRVRPDLIAMGEQRLREEDERRRKTWD